MITANNGLAIPPPRPARAGSRPPNRADRARRRRPKKPGSRSKLVSRFVCHTQRLHTWCIFMCILKSIIICEYAWQYISVWFYLWFKFAEYRWSIWNMSKMFLLFLCCFHDGSYHLSLRRIQELICSRALSSKYLVSTMLRCTVWASVCCFIFSTGLPANLPSAWQRSDQRRKGCCLLLRRNLTHLQLESTRHPQQCMKRCYSTCAHLIWCMSICICKNTWLQTYLFVNPDFMLGSPSLFYQTQSEQTYPTNRIYLHFVSNQSKLSNPET